MDNACSSEKFIEGDLEMLKHCDVIAMLPNWKKSEGAMIEYREALKQGKEVIFL
jgi:hypothetical protein